MKKLALSVVLVLIVSAGTFAQTALTAADYARAEKMLSYGTAPFVDRNGARGTWLPDGRFYYRALTPTGMEYVVVNPADGSRQAGATLAEIGIPSPGSGGTIGSTPFAIASPDGKLEAYIKNFNLYVKDKLMAKETQLTTDGVKDFGYATDNAGWKHSPRAILVWSPDSKKIATFQQDERNVSDSYLVSTNVGAPKMSTWKSALPGDPNVPMLHRVIIDVEAAKITKLQVPPDPHRSTTCDDISCEGGWEDVQWASDGKTLAFVSSTRDHKKATLRVADIATGAVRDVLEEMSPTQFEASPSGGGPNWRYLSESNEFIWYTEKDGWGHLYLYDATSGKLKNQITTGDFAVWTVDDVDTKGRSIVFTAGGREKDNDPYFGHVYRTGFDGKNLTSLTPENANHDVSWSPDGRYFVDNFSTPDTPATAVLRDSGGKLLLTLEKGDVSRLVANGWKPPTRITVKARDGKIDLYGLMFTPTNLDANKKYPIINYIYPGPQGGSVGTRNFGPSRNDNQALAELGFVVVAIDGMCNPLRSKAFHDSCYGNMADNTLEDQITGMKQLAEKYKYIDLDRVGIWGHSGGGFATAAAMFRYPEFFKVGISESGNHDNRNYEDDWGERYVGLLQGDNYEKQANQTYAKNLKGKLLLAHGTMDDNVPPGNTLLVVDALIKAGKDFDLIMIPNARHGYGPASYYMMRRRWDYFVKNLLGVEPPKEYTLTPKQDPRIK